MILVVELLQLLVLGCEAALCGGIHHQQHLALIVAEGYGVEGAVEDGELVDVVGVGNDGLCFLLAADEKQRGGEEEK